LGNRINQPIYTCGKCHHGVVESCVDSHLERCQPNGTRCGKCEGFVPSKGFVEHFKGCNGKPEPMVGDNGQ